MLDNFCAFCVSELDILALAATVKHPSKQLVFCVGRIQKKKA